MLIGDDPVLTFGLSQFTLRSTPIYHRRISIAEISWHGCSCASTRTYAGLRHRGAIPGRWSSSGMVTGLQNEEQTDRGKSRARHAPTSGAATADLAGRDADTNRQRRCRLGTEVNDEQAARSRGLHDGLRGATIVR